MHYDYNPTPSERAWADRVGITFQRRYEDGGPDFPDRIYWMAWHGHGGERQGVAVVCFHDVILFARQRGLVCS